ncbi:MAG: BRCT domain-containing protein, partial [Anaerolineales bacterium]
MEEDTFPKTYRKDRVIEYLEGQELLLNDAAPPVPKSKPRLNSLDIVNVAAAARPDPIPTTDGQNQILFTGFNASLREELEQKAVNFGLKVMKTAGKTLTFLCYGDNAGPAKVEKARVAGAFIIDSDQFLSMIQTG